MPLKASRDVVQVRQAVAKELKSRGVSTLRITRFATAVSEIARNAIVHGGGGEAILYSDRAAGLLLLECRDWGPGIADLAQALTDGYSSGSGLGRGLGGAKRLSDAFEIEPGPDRGCVVRMSIKV